MSPNFNSLETCRQAFLTKFYRFHIAQMTTRFGERQRSFNEKRRSFNEKRERLMHLSTFINTCCKVMILTNYVN
jgi:hypothetical protein